MPFVEVFQYIPLYTVISILLIAVFTKKYQFRLYLLEVNNQLRKSV